MNSKEKFDQENDVPKNIVPLGNDEIKSILKTQSEAVFEDKNLSNNSNFIKKTLIDIALDFKSKERNNENLENTVKIKEEVAESENNKNVEEMSSKDSNQTEKTVKGDIANEIDETDKLSDQSSSKPKLVDQNNDQFNTTSNDLNAENDQLENTIETNAEIDIENVSSQNQDQIDENAIISEPKTKIDETKQALDSQNQDQIDENAIISESDTKIDETQQALDSVRDAVSQSLNKNDDQNINLNENKEIQNDTSDIISKDFDHYKNIFSSLSNLGEKAIYEVVQSKIIEIAYELAGYQIDKMPEKYEKKIRSFLKNINCFEDKIKIEVNDQDYDALSKIKNFFDSQDKSIFVSNQNLSRGDIILNCDGMHYSEKSHKT